jgi:hypothetical protein
MALPFKGNYRVGARLSYPYAINKELQEKNATNRMAKENIPD